MVFFVRKIYEVNVIDKLLLRTVYKYHWHSEPRRCHFCKINLLGYKIFCMYLFPQSIEVDVVQVATSSTCSRNSASIIDDLHVMYCLY